MLFYPYGKLIHFVLVSVIFSVVQINHWCVISCRSCFASRVRDQNPGTPITWPRRIVTFTRLDSPLRLPLQQCGESFFPMSKLPHLRGRYAVFDIILRFLLDTQSFTKKSKIIKLHQKTCKKSNNLSVLHTPQKYLNTASTNQKYGNCSIVGK